MIRTRRLSILLLTTVAACTGRHRPAPVTDGATPGAGAAQEASWSTDSVAVEHPGATALLREVATPGQPTRLVFRFDTRVPSYRVSYRDTVIQCGSGEPVALPGAAHLVVSFRAAAAHDEAGHATVVQRDRAAPAPGVLRLMSFCDFEGDVSWAAALDRRARFRVSEQAPATLIVEIEPAGGM